MAEVYNVDGSTTGQAKNGRSFVATGGRGINFSKTYEPNGYFEKDLVDIDNYQNRLDDPRYYTGDSVT